MRMKTYAGKAAAGLLAAVLLIFTAVPAQAAAAGPEPETISISTAEDLAALSENCGADSYSRGKVFVLENDLDLSGISFAPIPVFAGTLEGNGHRITGLSIRQSGSNLGLFRFVEEGAVVRNLTVSADIMPGGAMKNIGGIAGTNRGRLENCAFEGTLAAKEAGGGIAGLNAAGGVITGCSNRGSLAGTKQIGGIAGKNEGLLEECSNFGDVGHTSQPVSELTGEGSALPSGEESALLAGESVFSPDDGRITDLGGVAGRNTGVVSGCENHGEIGYPHTGSNVGGIAGSQQGTMQSCSNMGTVSGRQNIGGIAGLFEPSLWTVYEESAAGQLRDQGSDLQSLLDEMEAVADEASDTSDEDLQAVRDSLDGLRDTLKDEGRRYRRKAGDLLDDLEDLLDDLEDIASESGSAAGEAEELINSLRQKLELLAALFGSEDGTGAASPEEILALFQEIADDFTALLDLLGGAASLPEDSLKALSSLGELTEDTLDETRDLLDDLRRTQRRLSRQAEDLWDELDRALDHLDDSKTQLQGQTDLILDQLDRMSDTLGEGFDRIQERFEADPAEESTWYTDLSDDETLSGQSGWLSGCENKGTILADSRGGGIAGLIGLEPGSAGSTEFQTAGSRSLRFQRYARATVLDCQNSGAISAQSGCSGGIAGRADLGAVIRCENYGTVLADDSSYAGGIAGYCRGLIRGCYVLCDARGKDHVGGIAGLGADTRDNTAMAQVFSTTGENVGSILGGTGEEASVSGNRFVNLGTAAVDGLTYESQAREITYQDLMGEEGTPSAFATLTVQFIADGQVVKTLALRYGDSVRQEEIPPVPDRDGKAGVWEEKDLSFVDRSIAVHAIYTDWIPTLSSGGEKPVLMVSGQFPDGAALTCRAVPLEGLPAADGITPIAAYEFALEGVGSSSKETAHRIRVLSEDGDAAALLTGEGWQLLSTQREGDYLIFSAPESCFAVVRTRHLPWGPTAGILLAAACGLLCLVRTRKKKRPEPQADEAAG